MGGIGARRETRADQRAFQRALSAYPYLLALELRTVAARGGEEFLAHGIVDDGMLQAAFLFHGDGHRKGGESMEKIRSSIEGMEHPNELVVAAAAAFLGQESVLRVAAPDGGDDVGSALRSMS